jgi:hypothetical protein
LPCQEKSVDRFGYRDRAAQQGEGDGENLGVLVDITNQPNRIHNNFGELEMTPGKAKEAGAEIRVALRTRMNRAGVTLAEIERRLGKNKNWLSNRMSGLVRLGVEELLAILIMIGEDPGQFFAEVVPPTSKVEEELHVPEVVRLNLERREHGE